MAKFTDLYIKRPVLATVVSLIILVIGIRSLVELPVRQYPKMENTVITVTTSYPGASADLIEGFITAPLEKKIATASGIDYLTSQSSNGMSTITANIKLNFDPNAAFTNIMSAVSEVQGQLPQEAQKPIIKKDTGSTTALMYLSYANEHMTPEQLTDYIGRVVQPKLETVSGVAEAQIMGGSTFAMRIWLNPIKMAAYGISASDITNALKQNNFQAAAGSTKGQYTAVTMNAMTDLQTESGFKQLVVKHNNDGALVRLGQVARVALGSEDYNHSVYMNGKKAVFVAISSTPEANPLTVITAVKKLLPSIERNYPDGMKTKVVYDATDFIRASIHEVMETILEATMIVIVVIFLFLGSLRSVFIPVITIPLSLVGVASFMLALGYSYNLLTLLALVLAIGLVVDDAIVVVENIYRHIEEGLSGFDAAMKGAAEIATPVISMTITLAAVYAPIGFMGGVTGALFTEFAFTLASAVIISGIIALTLSPMMCSKSLNKSISDARLVQFIDKRFEKIKVRYSKMLGGMLHARSVTIFFAFVVFVSCAFLYLNTSKELAPTEDQGALFVMGTGPQYANIDYTEKFTSVLNKIYSSYQSMENYFIINGYPSTGSSISAIVLKPWEQRSASQSDVLKTLQPKLNNIAGAQFQAFPLPSLPGGSSMPIEFEVTSTQSFKVLYPLVQKMLQVARKSGLFRYVTSDVKFNKPVAEYHINRSKAGQLGIPMQNIASTLAVALGGNYVNRFNMGGHSYKVIPQLERQYRLNPAQLDNLYVRADHNLIPLSTVASLSYKIEPNLLMHFQQLNAISIKGMTAPGITLGTGLGFLQQQANKILPEGVGYSYAGQSRRFLQEGSALMFTFMFSIIVIFLVLAAQFESFKDPLIVMISVPMAISGALIPLNAGLATINIYTQIGMITLIGLISKHGILMVEFANQLLHEQPGISRIEAMGKAASIRLRPVLMTTAAMIFGVAPLLFATGAGAVSRFDIGLVITSGMFIGTLFTLFIVPTMYTLKAKQLLLFIASVFATVMVVYKLLY
jgi:multidrug efflux pump